MTGEQVIAVLRNDLLHVRLHCGRVLLSPKGKIQPKHRELVRKHKSEVLRVLALWPNGEAPPRHPLSLAEPPRADERATAPRPQVITRQGHPWRRRLIQR